MTLEGYKKQFADSKNKMTLNDAANYVQRLLQSHYPMLPKTGIINRLEYTHRLACRTACLELIEALHAASPWEDYREIFAELEWPYMQRVVKHAMNHEWDGSCGKKIGKADALFVEMWFAYQEIFRKMPGNIPDITLWKIYNSVVRDVDQKTKIFRRNL